MDYDVVIEATEPTFEMRAFAELFNKMQPFLSQPSAILIDLRQPHFFGLAGVVPLIALVSEYAARGWIIDVAQPQHDKLPDYWESTGWLAAIIGQDLPRPKPQKSYIPITSFRDHHELNKAVNSVMDVLSIASEYPSGVLNAIEWTLNEIADNVLVHSQSSGWLQVISRPKKETIDFVVADCGIGILNSLKEGYPHLRTDGEALLLAIERGVTRDKSIGQGNGLAGSVRIAEAMDGWLNIVSQSGMLRIFNQGERNSLDLRPFPGTFVELTIPTTYPVDLSDALWGHTPASTFEFSHLDQSGIRFCLIQESEAFGNRASGGDLSVRLQNIINENPSEAVIIDFTDVDVPSASFLDEFLAKTIRKMGLATFLTKVRLVNMSPFVETTLNQVVKQRMGNP